MLQLLNTKTQEFLNLKEGTSFSFSASSQMQNLDKYEIGHSFDIELLNDENARIAVQYEEYQTGVTTLPEEYASLNWETPTYSRPRVILYKDGTPLFIGRLQLISSTLTTIKCAYKCLPYGPAFKDFEMRKQLRDYMYKERGFSFGQHVLNDMYDSNIVAISADKVNTILGYSFMIMEFENMPNMIKTSSNVAVESKETGWNLYVDTYRQYWMTIPINDILGCMNIHYPAKKPNEEVAHVMVPCRPHYKRLLKVRMYAGTKRARGSATLVDYKTGNSTPIFWLDDYTGKWSSITACKDGPTFVNSLRKMKALNGLKLLEIQYPPNFGKQYGCLGLNSYNTFPSIEFGVSSGKTYKDNDDIVIRMTGVSSTMSKPDYVDVVFEYELKLDYPKYCTDQAYHDLYARVPIMEYDFEFFETETTTFLNELSLNNKRYKWLRNPAFRNTDNYNAIHGYEYSIFWSHNLGLDNIESVTREINYDAPSGIRVVTPMGFDTRIEKRLNYLKTDAKEIKQGFTGLGIVNSSFDNLINMRGYPIAIYDLKDKTFIDNDLKGCFGCKVHNPHYSDYNGGRNRTGGTTQQNVNFWYANCNTDFDYLYEYANKGEKYTFVCVGYDLEENVEFEGQIFKVDKYTTNDFNKFTLECYPSTLWTDAAYEDPNEEISAVRAAVDYRGSGPSRNEFSSPRLRDSGR